VREFLHEAVETRSAAALTAGLVGPLTIAGPADADLVVLDPAGDAGGPRKLDVTKVKVRNDVHGVIVHVRFAKATLGDLIGAVDPRAATRVRLIAERDKTGETTSRVLLGAFTDQGGADGGEPCTNLRVRWKQEVARPVMTLPPTAASTIPVLRGGSLAAEPVGSGQVAGSQWSRDFHTCAYCRSDAGPRPARCVPGTHRRDTRL
jgi:hypothetical protein